MNPPVHCIHCGTLQNWDKSQWSLGPESARASFTCPSCYRCVTAESKTWAFICSQIEIEERA